MLKKVLHKHAPLKSRIIRANQVHFINKELSKAVIRRSQLKTKYNRTKQEADRNAYKKQQNLCVELRWKANKTHRHEYDIILIESNNIIKDRKNVAETS